MIYYIAIIETLLLHICTRNYKVLKNERIFPHIFRLINKYFISNLKNKIININEQEKEQE